MPTYKYRCKSCEHAFEAFQPITADPLVRCPSCEQDALKRLIGSGGGVIFKGSGFYVNDYARSGSAKAKSSASSDAPSTSSGSESSGSADRSCGSCGTTGPNVCD